MPRKKISLICRYCMNEYLGYPTRIYCSKECYNLHKKNSPSSVKTEKSCSKCGETKPIDQFGKLSSSKDGLKYYCKSCRSIEHSLYVQKNPEFYKKRYKNYRRRNPEKFLYSKEKYRINIEKILLWSAKARAKKKNLPFSIQLEDIVIPEKCPLCDVSLKVHDGQNAPSIDQIIIGFGYTSDNILVLCTGCNSRKKDATIEWLEKLLDYMKLYKSKIDNRIGRVQLKYASESFLLKNV